MPHSPAIAVMIDSWDSYDPWGSAMEAAFALCEVATAAGVYEVGAILEYRLGYAAILDLDEIAAVQDITSDDPRLPDSLTVYCLAVAYVNGELSDDDLIFGARVLSRYLDRCRKAGRDY